MNTLENIVASRDLCEEAAKRGLFGDSVLVWVVGFDRETPDKIESAVFPRKDSANLCQDMVKITGIFPAPTLAEILDKLVSLKYIDLAYDHLARLQCEYINTVWTVGYGHVGQDDWLFAHNDENPATAALRLLLKLKDARKE